jgi:hypothetical protein
VKVAYRAELATQSDYGASTLNYDALYATVSAGLVGKPGSLTIGYEQLGSDNNVGFGEEYDAQLTRKFGKYTTGLVKIANFRRDSLAFPNVQKVWAQVEFAY